MIILFIRLLLRSENIRTEENDNNLTYTKTPNSHLSISDPEIFIPIIIASIILIIVFIAIIICFRKRCPSCLPCLLC